MEENKIKLLLEKYWRAETTIEEEKFIKQYFETQELNDELIEDDKWFEAIKDFKSIEPNQVHFTDTQFKGNNKIVKLNLLLKIAASVAIVFGMTFLGINYNQKLQAEKDLALQQKAEASLISISKALNQGYMSFEKSAKLMTKNKSLN